MWTYLACFYRYELISQLLLEVTRKVEHDCRVKFVFLHPESNLNVVSVRKLVELCEIFETYYLVTLMREREEERPFPVLQTHVNNFELNQST